MGLLKVRTSTLAQAKSAASDADTLFFPTDQPHAIVHGGAVIGTTYTDGRGSFQDIPTSMHVAQHDIGGESVLMFDALPEEGIVHDVILTSSMQEEWEVEIDPDEMPQGISNVFCNGRYIASGNYDYIYIPNGGFLWMRYVRFGTNLYIKTL